MTPYIALAVAVIAAAAYLVFRKAPTRVVADMLGRSEKDRSMILIQATVWRLTWEAENPQFAGIYLDPWSFSPDICQQLFHSLLGIAASLADEQRAQSTAETVDDDVLDACRAWGVTIGARLGKGRVEDVERLWGALKPTESSLRDALKELKSRQEMRDAMGRGGQFLQGISIQQIVEEVHRVPVLQRWYDQMTVQQILPRDQVP
jgi:hypothetical protein